MRILILSLPFHGIEEIGKAIARDTDKTFISDPMNLDYYGQGIRHYYHNGDEIVYQEGGIERPYIFDNDVPNNTIITHYVGMNKLPNLYTEVEFLDAWAPKFDTIVGIKSTNLERAGKRWMAADSQENMGNIQYKMYHRQHCNEYQYEDGMYDQAIVDKLTSASNTLDSYLSLKGYSQINVQDITRQDAEDIALEEVNISAEYKKLNIGVDGLFHSDGSVKHERIWSTTNGGWCYY
jgi:hypothetical protein